VLKRTSQGTALVSLDDTFYHINEIYNLSDIDLVSELRVYSESGKHLATAEFTVSADDKMVINDTYVKDLLASLEEEIAPDQTFRLEYNSFSGRFIMKQTVVRGSDIAIVNAPVRFVQPEVLKR
jgi:hypothetical protein